MEEEGMITSPLLAPTHKREQGRSLWIEGWLSVSKRTRLRPNPPLFTEADEEEEDEAAVWELSNPSSSPPCVTCGI